MEKERKRNPSKEPADLKGVEGVHPAPRAASAWLPLLAMEVPALARL